MQETGEDITPKEGQFEGFAIFFFKVFFLKIKNCLF